VSRDRRRGQVQVRALAIFAAVVVLVGAGVAAGHYVRKRSIANRGLAEGLAAYERQDWRAACAQLRRYLERYPREPRSLEAWQKFARAHLRVRPASPRNIASAIEGYRQTLKLDAENDEAWRQLERLYTARNDPRLKRLALERIERRPDDAAAQLALGRALLQTGDANEEQEGRRRLIGLLQQLEARDVKSPIYVDACGLLHELANRPGSAGKSTSAPSGNRLEWLDRAVAYDPGSAAALLRRAHALRLWARDAGPPSEGSSDELTARARDDLERATALEPDSPSLRLFLSAEWLEHGDLQRAAEQLQAVDRLPPEKLAEDFPVASDWALARFVQAARIALGSDDATGAAELADRALAELQPHQRLEALPEAIRLYLRAGRAADARRGLEEYRHLLGAADSAGRDEATYLEALVARAESEPRRVISLLEPLAAARTAPPALWALLAEAYSRTQQTQRAIDALTRYLRAQPRDVDARRQLVREYIAQRQWLAALSEATALVQTRREEDVELELLRWQARLNLAAEADASDRARHAEGAERELGVLAQRFPQRVDVRVLLALAVMLRGDVEQADQVLRQASEECSKPLPAELERVWLHYGAARLERALELCREVCRRHPAVAAPWEMLIELLMRQGRADEAQSALQAAIQRMPDPAERRRLELRLAEIEIRTGRRESGVERLRRLAADDPRDLQVRELLLALPEIRHDAATAQELVGELQRIEGEAGLRWRYQQAAVWLAGDDWRARQAATVELLERCRSVDPSWTEPALLLGQLHERLGDPQQAEKVYRDALARNPRAAEVADRLLTLLGQHKRVAEQNAVLDMLQLAPGELAQRRLAVALSAADYPRAIDVLHVRASADARDAVARILLARLVYRQDADADRALAHLEEAERIAGDTAAIVAARVDILRAAGRDNEASRLLDERVARRDDAESLLLRARYRFGAGRIDLAEQDYRAIVERWEQARAFELLGAFYAGTERLSEGIATWERGLQRFPDSIELQRRLIKGLVLRNAADDRQRAESMLDALRRQVPNDPELLQVKAGLLLDSRLPAHEAQASQMLAQVVRLDPRAVPAHTALINLEMKNRRYAAARELTLRALGSNPDNPDLLLARCRAEQALGQIGAARELARLVLLRRPADPQAVRLFVDLSLAAGGPPAANDALGVAQRAVQQAPAVEALRLALADVLLALGRHADAVRSLEEFVAGQPQQTGLASLLAMARISRDGGELEAAERFLDQAADRAANDPAVVRERISLLAARREYERLAAFARQADPPPSPDALTAAATELLASEQAAHGEAAVRLLEAALEKLPAGSTERSSVAGLLYRAGAVDRAIAVYREVLQASPENVRALNDLAWILAEAQREYAQALELANRGVALDPQEYHVRDTRGVILAGIPGRLGDARRDFEACLRLAGEDRRARARTLLQLGRVSARLKDPIAVRRHLKEAQQIDDALHVFTAEERAEISSLLTPRSEE